MFNGNPINEPIRLPKTGLPERCKAVPTGTRIGQGKLDNRGLIPISAFTNVEKLGTTQIDWLRPLNIPLKIR